MNSGYWGFQLGNAQHEFDNAICKALCALQMVENGKNWFAIFTILYLRWTEVNDQEIILLITTPILLCYVYLELICLL